jgi:Family of unknown function (DUF6263)
MLLVRTRTVLCAVLAGTVLCLAQAPAQAQTTLRYKFKVGDLLNYDMQQKMEMKMTVANMDITMDMKQHMDMSWRVVEVDKDGKARIDQKIERIRMTMDGPGPIGKMEYDSKDGKEPEGPIGKVLGPVFNALAGSNLSVTMDSRGEISDVKLPEKLSEALKKLAGAGPGLGDMFSPEGLKRMINQGGLVLPKEPVNKGSTWTQKMDNKMPFGTMKVTNTMVYDGTTSEGGKTLEKISVKPVIAMEPDPNAPIALKIKGSDSKGTALFDNARGRLAEMNIVQNMQMEVNAGGMDIAQNIRTTTILKLRPKAQ